MKLRTLIFAAGALLVTGGTTVFAGRNVEAMQPDAPGYQAEYPFRETNRTRMRDAIDDRDWDFEDERYEERFRDMERFHSEWDDLTEEEREDWFNRRNENLERYENRSFGGYGMMGSRRSYFPGHGCGFRR